MTQSSYRIVIMKAMAYDLLCLMDDCTLKGETAITSEEIKKLIVTYIEKAEQDFLK